MRSQIIDRSIKTRKRKVYSPLLLEKDVKKVICGENHTVVYYENGGMHGWGDMDGRNLFVDAEQALEYVKIEGIDSCIFDIDELREKKTVEAVYCGIDCIAVVTCEN